MSSYDYISTPIRANDDIPANFDRAGDQIAVDWEFYRSLMTVGRWYILAAGITVTVSLRIGALFDMALRVMG